jgi:hypothetical protein
MTKVSKRSPACKVSRRVELLRPAGPGGLAVLRLAAGPDEGTYWVRRIGSDIGGEAFEVIKQGAGEDGRYHVRLDGGHSTCECRGFLRWNKPCRHIWGCERASARGWL